MATWSDYLASAGGSAVSGLIGGLFSSSNQKKQNKFAAEQAELDRQFQAEQAQLANEFTTSERLASQQWEEDWYNNYSSPQAMVSQYEEAGLNPALMYGQAGASTGETPSAPSGSSGAYASGSKATPLQGLSSLDYLQFAVDAFSKITSAIKTSRESFHQNQVNDWYDSLMSSELEERNSRILLNQAKETGVYEEVLNSRVGRELSKSQIKEVSIRADWYREQIEKTKADVELSKVEKLKMASERALVDQQFKQREGLYPYEMISKQLDIDQSKALKAYNWFFDKIQRKYDSEYNVDFQKFLNEIEEGKLTDAQIDKLKSETWYQDFNNEFLRITGCPLNMNVLQFLGHNLSVLGHVRAVSHIGE